MSSGASRVSKALSDTGPILHLHEIERLDALGVFAQIEVPARVALELERLGLPPAAIRGRLGGAELVVTAPRTEQGDEGDEIGENGLLQPADRQVLALASRSRFRLPVLTDDLALRRRVEQESGVAVGSVGLLVRSFKLGRCRRSDLDQAVEALMSRSSLHMSRPIRRYVLELIRDLADR